MNTQIKVIAGFAAAALAGFGIGLLLAPSSGKETREKLLQGANETANRLLEVVRANGEAIKEKAGALVDDAKAAFNQAKGYARSEANHVEELIGREV